MLRLQGGPVRTMHTGWSQGTLLPIGSVSNVAERSMWAGTYAAIQLFSAPGADSLANTPK